MDRYGEELAEGEGFEPPVPFQAQRFSRPPVSTAHPSLRGEDLFDCKAKRATQAASAGEQPRDRGLVGLEDPVDRVASNELGMGRGATLQGIRIRNMAKAVEITVH